MLQQNVNEPQREIERGLQAVFKHWSQPFDIERIHIRNLSLVVDLPDYVLNALTTEEKRIWVSENYDVELQEAQPTAPIDPIQTALAMVGVGENVPMNISKSEIEARYKEYKSLVNMTYKELQIWSESDCCKALGYSKQPIQRNLHLLNTNKSEWGAKEYRLAGQIIKAIERILDLDLESEVYNGDSLCGTKKELALKNLGYKI